MKMSTTAKVMVCFMTTLQYSVIGFPVGIFCLLVFDPCFPPFLLSMSTNCSAIKWTNFGPEILVLVFETWMAAQAIYSGCIWAFYILFVGITCALNYLQVVRCKMARAKKLVQHKLCIRTYRQVHIVEKMFNDYLMARITPAIVMAIPAIQIVTQFVSVTMHDQIAMPGFLVFPLFLVNGFINNVLVFTLASWINSTSKEMLEKFGRQVAHVGGKGRAYLRKEVQSLNCMKIKFGTNFIDRGTPLVIQNFCLAQTMSLVLIRSSKAHK
ncbi:hypothetical protein Fcan01_17605 [Folsomia candida]|uniref:Uncharacterized protein n=2 Tax=Folsomia candida TaxID=158441 RepID=A0A226DQY5_FOLCA|nr:hypothetical protein Fcan01_17605 [Folsomia candida]